MAFGVLEAFFSWVIILIGALLVLYIIYTLGRLLIGLVVNIILGFIAIFVINALFGIGIPWDPLVIVITAVLGLPGVAIIVILKLIGINL